MRSGEARSLLVVAPAPIIPRGDRVELDVKFVEGMRYYRDQWDGPISCLLFEGASSIPFGREYEQDALPFSLRVLQAGSEPTSDDLEGHDVIFGSADSHTTLNLPDLCRAGKQRCVLAIEYTLRTRLDIVRLERRPMHKRVYSALWTLAQERRRRSAMARADGLQANGYPAFDAYGALCDDRMLYLDNRMRPELLATDAEMRTRRQRLLSDAPLRIVHSGRLETLKGAQDLIPVAVALRDRGLPFELEIFGTGSLEDQIRDGIAAHGLGDCVHLRGTVDFETELVPHARASADLFLSCHRQSDPSCTYIESMGCGLAIAGYGNAMLARLMAESGAGWCAPLGNARALADCLADAAGDTADTFRRCERALGFSRRHDFHEEFRRRIAHLRGECDP